MRPAESAPESWGERLGTRWRELLGDGLFAYSRLVMLTSCFRVEGWQNMDAAQTSGRPLLWSLWHEQMMTLSSLPTASCSVTTSWLWSSAMIAAIR